jgi:hypothetical protein
MKARVSKPLAASPFFYGPPDLRRRKAGRHQSHLPSPQPERQPQPAQAWASSAVRGTTYAGSVEVGIRSGEPGSYRGHLARDIRATVEASRKGRPPREGGKTMKGTTRTFVIALAMATILATTGAAVASSSGCAQSAPRASATNNWAWGAPGSWGMPGQQLSYHILVVNNDVGCGSSSFVISASAPDGFAVSIPTNTITLTSASTGYLWANVTSPSGVADGNYALAVSVNRAGTSSPAASSTTTYYKVYSSDTVAPTFSWSSPSDGETISGRTYRVAGASTDDHAVRRIDLYIDNVYTSTTLCDDISYECRVSYKWTIRKVHGQHTATFESTDWMGNVAALTVTFTVS